ncbi:MAG: TIGR00282 family metallophosphoesterase [Candidatus Ratteibacteria bacterium]|nr:TIGR00282 family metallophosphoesterase [Candidatus Ratteibacteria bacterium]
MKILFIGDIVGKPGRQAVLNILPALKKERKIDLTIANGENAAGGFGLTLRVAEELFSMGIDVLTSGNHIWDKKEIIKLVETEKRLLRPANYAPGVPGLGSGIFTTRDGEKAGVINLEGRIFMSRIECPFRTAEREIEKLEKAAPNIIIDMHAEATSEKIALSRFLDGKVGAIIGTHTHVQTADEMILPGGTAYISDVGMTGPRDSVIGVKSELILQRFLTGMPTRFEVATEDIWFSSVIVELKEGKARSIERVNIPWEKNKNDGKNN